jgi:uncharacterized protein YeaO (DUF488 family)
MRDDRMTDLDQKLRIKRVYEPRDDGDGMRVLVDRVWPRGMTKEDAALSLWLKDIAPSTELRKWFGHDPKRWDEFQRRYRAELAQNDAAVAQLLALLHKGKVTLLYSAHDVAHNQAVALRNYMIERAR